MDDDPRDPLIHDFDRPSSLSSFTEAGWEQINPAHGSYGLCIALLSTIVLTPFCVRLSFRRLTFERPVSRCVCLIYLYLYLDSCPPALFDPVFCSSSACHSTLSHSFLSSLSYSCTSSSELTDVLRCRLLALT